MLKQLKRLAGDSMIYGISGIVSKMIGIFLVPIYTRLFIPEDYGIINLVNTSFFLLSIFVVCSMDNSVARWFYDTEDTIDHKKSFSAYIWFQFGAAILFASIIILFCGPISRFFFKEAGKPVYFLIPALSLITNILPAVLINWFRVHKRPVATVIFTLSQILTTVGLTIYFVIFLKWKITGVFAALAISSFIFSVVAFFILKEWLSLKFFTLERVKTMLKFALPMIPAGLSYWLLNSTDSYFIKIFTKSTAEVGLFGIGAMLASTLGLFTGAFQQAWGPFAFSIINKPEASKVYAKVFLLYGYIMGFAAAMLMVFAPEGLLLFTTPKYYGAAWVAGILGYNLLLIGFSYIAIIGISIKKTTAPYGVAMLYATIVTMALNVILIPGYGKEGSALATVLAQLLVPIYLFYRGQKVYPIPYAFKEVSIVVFLLAACAVLIRLITFKDLLFQELFKISAALFILFIIVYINRSSFKLLLKSVRKYKTEVNLSEINNI